MSRTPIILGSMLFLLLALPSFADSNIIANFSISGLNNSDIRGLNYNGSVIGLITNDGAVYTFNGNAPYGLNTSCNGALVDRGLILRPDNLFYAGGGNAVSLVAYDLNTCTGTTLNNGSSSWVGNRASWNYSSIDTPTPYVDTANASTFPHTVFIANYNGKLILFNWTGNINNTTYSNEADFQTYSNGFASGSLLYINNNTSDTFKAYIWNATNGNTIKSFDLGVGFDLKITTSPTNSLGLSALGNWTSASKYTWLALSNETGKVYFYLVDLENGFNASLINITAVYPANSSVISQNSVNLEADVQSANNGTIAFYLNGTNIGNKSYLNINNSSIQKIYFGTNISDGAWNWSADFFNGNTSSVNSGVNSFSVKNQGLVGSVGSTIGSGLGVTSEAGMNIFAMFLSLLGGLAIFLITGKNHKSGAQIFVITFIALLFLFVFVGWLNIIVGVIIVIIAGFMVTTKLSQTFMGG